MGPSFLTKVLVVLSCSFKSMLSLSLELAPYPLPGNLYPSTKKVTGSGTETGGVFCQMIQFSHSKYIKGCAVYSSTFYRCGPPNGNMEDYEAMCTKDSNVPPDQQWQVSQAVSELQSYDATHVIDSLQYMRDSKLYVYCGLQNEIFRADQQLNVVALYERYLASAYFIYTRVQDTSTLLRTINPSDPDSATCPRTPQADGTVSPNCTSLSAPAEALGFLLGGSYSKYINPFYPHFRYVHLEPLRSFNQTEFTVGLDDTGLDEVGYYYVPRYCQYRSHANRNNYGHKQYSQPCQVHVYFHGCEQGRNKVGTSHVMSSNYLEIAELNYIIMLFPQALPSEANPLGCFDFAGFTGVLYATKSGPQVEAVWRMLERLLGLMPEKTTSTYYRTTGRSGGGGDSYNKNDNYNRQKSNYGKNYNRDAKYGNNMGCSTCGSKVPPMYQ